MEAKSWQFADAHQGIGALYGDFWNAFYGWHSSTGRFSFETHSILVSFLAACYLDLGVLWCSKWIFSSLIIQENLNWHIFIKLKSHQVDSIKSARRCDHPMISLFLLQSLVLYRKQQIAIKNAIPRCLPSNLILIRQCAALFCLRRP